MAGPLADLEARLRAALALDLAYGERPPRQPGRPAAVLALFAWWEEAGEPALLMTRRSEQVLKHRGQMAFPGGGREEADESDEHAALREAEEEVGIRPADVRVVGRLPELWTVTDFSIRPVVGLHADPIERIPLVAQQSEIADVFWIPLSVLGAPATYRRELIEVPPAVLAKLAAQGLAPPDGAPPQYPIHVYQVGESRIWGATGAMIKNLLDRLASV